MEPCGVSLQSSGVFTIMSKCIGAYLGAVDIHLGSSRDPNGMKFMRFGKSISARSNLWLEAGTPYEEQAFNPIIANAEWVSFRMSCT